MVYAVAARVCVGQTASRLGGRGASVAGDAAATAGAQAAVKAAHPVGPALVVMTSGWLAADLEEQLVRPQWPRDPAWYSRWRAATVIVKPVGYLHQAATTVTIAGEEVGSHFGAYHAALKAAVAKYPGCIYAIGPVLFTAAEAGQIQQVYDEVQATIPPDWNFMREQFAAALDGAERAAGVRAAERFDQDYADPWGGPEAIEDQRGVTEARKALAAFDAEHPEVAAQAAAQREAAVRRALEGRD